MYQFRNGTIYFINELLQPPQLILLKQKNKNMHDIYLKLKKKFGPPP